MKRTIITVVGLLASVGAADARAQQGAQGLRLRLSAEKETYALGEPVVLTAELRNTGNAGGTVIYRLAPEYGLVEYRIKAPSGQLESLRPVSNVNVRRSFRKSLEPGTSVFDTVKLFYASTGWTMREPGTYTVTAAYPGAKEKIEASVEIIVTPPTPSEGPAAKRMLVNDQQGLLLYWEHGDQLTEGIRNFEVIAEEFPRSPLSAYANCGLGLNLSKDFYDGRTDKVRPANHRAAIGHLKKALAGKMDSYFRVQATLALAASFIAVQENQSARQLLRAFADEFKDDLRYEKQLDRARELLASIR